MKRTQDSFKEKLMYKNYFLGNALLNLIPVLVLSIFDSVRGNTLSLVVTTVGGNP